MIHRNTIQRSLILESMNKLKCHPTAEEVYADIAKKHANISRATVYRNLNQLTECGEIRKIEIAGGADRYDDQCHDHYHVKCMKCGRVFDVDMETIPNLEKQVKDWQGFSFSGHDILFKGICPKCK